MDAMGEAKVVWKAWMKEQISVTEGMSCDVLDWWKENSARFPLIAKAEIVLATRASWGNLRAPFQADHRR